MQQGNSPALKLTLFSILPGYALKQYVYKYIQPSRNNWWRRQGWRAISLIFILGVMHHMPEGNAAISYNYRIHIKK